MKHSPSLLAKSNLITLLKTSLSILNTHISQKNSYSLNIEQSSLFLPPLTPISSEPLLKQQHTLKTYEDYEANLIIVATHQPISSKIILKSSVSGLTSNKETKEMPLLSEKAKLQNMIIKKLAHVHEKSNGSNLMSRSNVRNKSGINNDSKLETEEVVDVTNISVLLEKNLTRNYTPNKSNIKVTNAANDRLNLTPQNDKSFKKTNIMKESQMKQSQILKESQIRNNKKWNKTSKVPQIEFKVNFTDIKRKNNEIKSKKKSDICNKR